MRYHTFQFQHEPEGLYQIRQKPDWRERINFYQENILKTDGIWKEVQAQITRMVPLLPLTTLWKLRLPLPKANLKGKGWRMGRHPGAM